MQHLYAKRLLIAAAASTLLLIGGCAPKNWNQEEDGVFDPLEDINRNTYRLNKGLDFILLKPAATVYEKFPPPVKTGIGNFFDNLKEPANIVNNALQEEGDATVNSGARLVINSVFGLGGLIDVADMWDIPEQKADFGQTLRGYGMDNTAYLVLPLLGPTTFTDGIGSGGDSLLYPPTYIKSPAARNSVVIVNAVHQRADLLPFTRLVEETALDEYVFVRNAYEQRRQAQVNKIFTAK